MQDVKEKLGQLSLTNQYQVHFSALKPTITDYLEGIGLDNTKDFLSRDAGILCSEASLPVTYGTADLLRVTVTFNYDRYIVTRSSN